MSIARIAMTNPRVFVLGLVTGVLLIGSGFVLALLATNQVRATNGVSGNVYSCVSVYTGATRLMFPGQAPKCNAGELPVELGGAGAIAALQAQVDALEAQVPDCLAEEAGDAVFTGCDVEIRNGLGGTETTNAKGNLIVGYSENPQGYGRTGSHNIVVGKAHGYTSYGGFVAGQFNQITAGFTSVGGGQLNTARGETASVGGGESNVASGFGSTVGDGANNKASASFSNVSGGQSNEASNFFSSVTGGFSNSATGEWSSVSGGENNVADGDSSSVSGGLNHTISVEGFGNTDHDWIAGALVQDF